MNTIFVIMLCLHSFVHTYFMACDAWYSMNSSIIFMDNDYYDHHGYYLSFRNNIKRRTHNNPFRVIPSLGEGDEKEKCWLDFCLNLVFCVTCWKTTIYQCCGIFAYYCTIFFLKLIFLWNDDFPLQYSNDVCFSEQDTVCDRDLVPVGIKVNPPQTTINFWF